MPLPRNGTTLPVVAGTAVALPPHHYSQDELLALVKQILPDLKVDEDLLRKFFASVGVEERYLALRAEEYADLGGLEKRSEAFLSVALELGERAIRAALGDARTPMADIGEIVTTCSTGFAVPSLEARLMNHIELSPDTRRVPLFGLGCAGGAAGVALVADYLRAYPERAAILLSVELCSLTFQPEDLSTSNVIGAGLFGDAAGAVVMVGGGHPLARDTRGPAVVASRSVFFRDTERVMGWDVVDTGFKLVLSPDIPQLARDELPGLMREFLADSGLSLADVDLWIPHAGGPKIIEAVADSLPIGPDELADVRDNLAHLGNVSSASVLALLDQIRREKRPPPGTHAVMLAFGPAFCAEVVLLRW